MTRRQLLVRCDDSPRCPRSSAFCHICLQLAGVPSPTCCIHVLRGRPGGLRQLVPGQRPAFIATICSSAWCAGVVASSLTTWPNSVWRRLVIMTPMFGRPVVSAMSVFFTWSCHLTPSSWRWHPIWNDCNLRISSASRVHVSAPCNSIWRTQVWYQLWRLQIMLNIETEVV